MAALIPVERQRQITSLIQKEKVVRVTDLSELFGVSVLTIRRDLDLLEERGVLERSHGGAVLRRRMASEPLYRQKAESGAEEKRRIAAAAAATVKENETVFINSGSTTREVIRALEGRRVRVVTNNLDAVTLLQEELPEVILIGGTYRSRSMSTVGDNGIAQISTIFADRAIIGVDGFSLRHGITSPVEAQAAVTKAMMAQTQGEVIAVADHSKIGVVSNFLTTPLEAVSLLITDSQAESLIDPEVLAVAGTELKLV